MKKIGVCFFNLVLLSSICSVGCARSNLKTSDTVDELEVQIVPSDAFGEMSREKICEMPSYKIRDSIVLSIFRKALKSPKNKPLKMDRVFVARVVARSSNTEFWITLSGNIYLNENLVVMPRDQVIGVRDRLWKLIPDEE